MKNFKVMLLALPLLLTSCGPSATPITVEEGKEQLNHIIEVWGNPNSALPVHLVTVKDKTAWSERFQTTGTYHAEFTYDNDRPNDFLAYSKEVHVNHSNYKDMTVQRWVKINPDETKAEVFSYFSDGKNLYEDFDLTNAIIRGTFVNTIKALFLSPVVWGTSVAVAYSADIETQKLGNTYNFAMIGEDLELKVSHVTEEENTNSRYVYSKDVLVDEKYEQKMFGAVTESYHNVAKFDKKSIPALPDVKFF